MGYRLAPVEVNPAEGGFAEFRICNEFDEPITTFGFADEHEARIGRALMIRATKNAVLIISHASVAPEKVNSQFRDITEIRRHHRCNCTQQPLHSPVTVFRGSTVWRPRTRLPGEGAETTEELVAG